MKNCSTIVKCLLIALSLAASLTSHAQSTCSLTATPTVITAAGSSAIHCNDCSVAGCDTPMLWQYQCDLTGPWTTLGGGTVDDITIGSCGCNCIIAIRHAVSNCINPPGTKTCTTYVNLTPACRVYDYLFSTNVIGVYPNPGKGTFTLTQFTEENSGNVNVMVYDFLGKIVFTTQQTVAAHEDVQLDLTHLPNGFYSIRVLNTNKAVDTMLKVVKN